MQEITDIADLFLGNDGLAAPNMLTSGLLLPRTILVSPKLPVTDQPLCFPCSTRLFVYTHVYF